jgi:endonuclease-3
MNKAISDQIFQRLQQNNPSPTTELEYSSTFELLIAVMLSAQATDISVNKATKKLFAVANNPQAMLDLGELKLKSYIRTIGLFNTKAINVIKTCEMLIHNYNNKVPDTREQLEKLPGVGRKTANVILNTAFKQPVIAVDTHIFRVANRIGLAKATNVLATEKQLQSRISKKYLLDAHHWLILHGRYTCTARKPKCSSCIIADLCQYNNKAKS